MILDVGEDEDKKQKELNDDFTINEAEGTDVKVFEKFILGNTDTP